MARKRNHKRNLVEKSGRVNKASYNLNASCGSIGCFDQAVPGSSIGVPAKRSLRSLCQLLRKAKSSPLAAAAK